MRNRAAFVALGMLLGIACLVQPVSAERFKEAVRKGNESFTKKDFKSALEQYRIADADQPETPAVNYNLGGALYEDGKYEEAAAAFQKALNTDDPALRTQAQYNLGNSLFRKEDYPGAIQAYQEALKLTPDDLDAKYNLELARRMLKENTKPKQQDQNQQQQQQQQQDQQQQDQQQQDQNQQQQDQQKQQSQESKQNQDKQNQQNAQQAKMSKEDAERILNALKDKENDTQKKVKRAVGSSDYKGKDW